MLPVKRNTKDGVTRGGVTTDVTFRAGLNRRPWISTDNKKPAKPYAVRVSWTSLVTVGPVFGGLGYYELIR